MKRSTSKLYRPWFGIVSILFAVVLVSACAVGGGSWRGLEIGITDCTNGDEYDRNDYLFDEYPLLVLPFAKWSNGWKYLYSTFRPTMQRGYTPANLTPIM